MRLKKLEIKGFKSFADKTVIHFNENITGIVGPNGCGKSNVVDAIRWVLGEQKTSQLRLEKMDNVLFNGCKTRKATNLAEVSLSFENTKNILPTEFTEVTITRKLYRSGESEYKINDVACRLKDIQNLFIDSGIGSDSYAIIELGMVDEILQNRENARRRLFEQASSITKYKIRKKESITKLKQTEESLERLQDLLAEIESNIKQLETQARRAERYNQIREEYKEVMLGVIKHQLTNYKANYNELYNQKKTQTEAKNALDTEVSKLQSTLEREKLSLLDKEKELSQAQKQFNELLGGIGKTENYKNILKEQIAGFEQRNKDILEQNKVLEVEKNEIKKQLGALELEKKKLELELEAMQPKLAHQKNEMQKLESTFAANKNILEQDKVQFNALQKEVFELDKHRSILKNNIEQQKKEIEKISLEISTKNQSTQKIAEDYKISENTLAQLNQELTVLEQIQAELLEKISSQDAIIQDNKSKVITTQRALDSKRNEYSLLKSMIDNLEGYPESIKHLKRQLKSYQNKMVLQDLIHCPNDYKALVEQLFQGVGNYFVVRTEAEAAEAIESLKQYQAGKSGFWILERIEKLPKPSFEIIPGAISALEIIEIDTEYKVLLQHLLAHTYFIPTGFKIDWAKYQHLPFKFIEIESGRIIENKSIFGGAKSLFDGAQVGRKKNAENLKTEVETLEKELSKRDRELVKSLEVLSNLKEQSKAEEISALQNIIKLQNEQYTKAKVVFEQSELIIEQLQAQLTQKNKELAMAKEQLIQKNKEYEQKFSFFTEFQQKIESQSSEFENYLTLFNKGKTELVQIESNYLRIQNELDQKNIQKEFFEHKLTQLANQLSKNNEKWLENQQSEKNKIAELQSIETTIADNYSEKYIAQKQIELAEKNYYTHRGELIELEKLLKETEQKRTITNELNQQLELKIQELRGELNSIKERLDIEFGIVLNDFINTDLSVSTPLADLQQRAQIIRKRIETYGEVNPMAIESYREVKERFDFLTSQKNDILDSKNNLLQTIKEIDITAKERFLESFTQVRENFIRTFRILFTEDDTCDLFLSDPENPIDSDIEIIAMPKGKKPLTINQLSGGEKTLTATALLFSLYLLKPAPFCIFDEVDAPLDDNNIAKFNKLINEFSKNSQFIIVTHNKQTMASVEILYGVTMIEQGVSKLVAVDFRNLA